jgi:hypothetical protein
MLLRLRKVLLVSADFEITQLLNYPITNLSQTGGLELVKKLTLTVANSDGGYLC